MTKTMFQQLIVTVAAGVITAVIVEAMRRKNSPGETA